MNKTTGLLLNIYSWIRTPGVIAHELSHLLVVILTPGVSVTSVDLTGEIEHEGKYTGTRMFLISYAPVYIAIGIVYAVVNLYSFSLTTGLTDAIISIGLLYVSFSLLIGMMPSYIDALNPVRMSIENTVENPVSLAPFYLPVILCISLPFLILTRIMRDYSIVGALSDIIVAIAILLIFFGIIDIDIVLSVLRDISLRVS